MSNATLQQPISMTPTVPIDFNLDDADLTIASVPASGGTAIAVANAIRLAGTNGIQTIQTATAGEIVIGFYEANGTTTGVEAASLTITVPTNTVETYQILVAGLADNNDAVGAFGSAVAKNIAGTASLVGSISLIVNKEASLVDADVTISTVGATLSVNVLGVAGRTINWSIVLPGIASI